MTRAETLTGWRPIGWHIGIVGSVDMDRRIFACTQCGHLRARGHSTDCKFRGVRTKHSPRKRKRQTRTTQSTLNANSVIKAE